MNRAPNGVAPKKLEESEVSLPPEIPQPVNRLDTQPATAEQLKNVQREMTGFERATVRLAQIALGISILAAMFVCLQWWEMHTGGQDTHALAEAAKVQSEQAKAQTDKMSESLTKTVSLIEATNNLAKQAKRSADVAQKALIASIAADRPWIGILLDVPVDITKEGSIKATALNTGKSAALVTKFQIAEAFYKEFPKNPEYSITYGGPKLSEVLMVPNTQAGLPWPSKVVAEGDIRSF